MDMNDLRGLGTVLCFVAFMAVVWWAYSPARRERFTDDAKMPFADDPENSAKQENRSE